MKSEQVKTLIIVILVGVTAFLYSKGGNNGVSERPFFSTDVSFAPKITCTYPQILNVNYMDNKITQNLPQSEANPMIFTFSDLANKTTGQLSYLDSTRTITTVPIYKINEDEEKIVYLDGGDVNYLSTHTLFKKKGVSIYTKSVDLLGTPVGSLAMGDCVPF
jgi:hypothetical protein